MNKHTLGPWTQCAALSSDAHNIRYIIGKDGEHIANVASGFKHSAPNDFDQDTALANARLIKAAPDMLAALRKVETWMASLPLNYRASPAGRHELDAVRVAIAQAEGGSNV
jgi:hypothetical protein